MEEMELFPQYVLDTTGISHPGFVSASLFRMWRENRGVWRHTGCGSAASPPAVTYEGWRHDMVVAGVPLTNEHMGTAALQRHFLLTTDARAEVMRQRLAAARDGSAARTGKRIRIRMISKKSSTFSGGVGRDAAAFVRRFGYRVRG